MDDLIAFEEIEIQSELSELQIQIDACEDHDARGELVGEAISIARICLTADAGFPGWAQPHLKSI